MTLTSVYEGLTDGTLEERAGLLEAHRKLYDAWRPAFLESIPILADERFYAQRKKILGEQLAKAQPDQISSLQLELAQVEAMLDAIPERTKANAQIMKPFNEPLDKARAAIIDRHGIRGWETHRIGVPQTGQPGAPRPRIDWRQVVVSVERTYHLPEEAHRYGLKRPGDGLAPTQSFQFLPGDHHTTLLEDGLPIEPPRTNEGFDFEAYRSTVERIFDKTVRLLQA